MQDEKAGDCMKLCSQQKGVREDCKPWLMQKNNIYDLMCSYF